MKWSMEITKMLIFLEHIEYVGYQDISIPGWLKHLLDTCMLARRTFSVLQFINVCVLGGGRGMKECASHMFNVRFAAKLWNKALIYDK